MKKAKRSIVLPMTSSGTEVLTCQNSKSRSKKYPLEQETERIRSSIDTVNNGDRFKSQQTLISLHRKIVTIQDNARGAPYQGQGSYKHPNTR